MIDHVRSEDQVGQEKKEKQRMNAHNKQNIHFKRGNSVQKLYVQEMGKKIAIPYFLMKGENTWLIFKDSSRM